VAPHISRTKVECLTTKPHYHPKYRDKKIHHDSDSMELLIIYEKFLIKLTEIETKNFSSDEKPKFHEKKLLSLLQKPTIAQ
jgi:hypothetical protein